MIPFQIDLALHADIDVSSSGDNTVIAGVSGKRIAVTGYLIIAAGDVVVSWETSGGTVLAGPIDLIANGGATPAFNPVGQFTPTPVGEGLVLNLGGAVQVGGHISYYLI